jgi:hypothetical protein
MPNKRRFVLGGNGRKSGLAVTRHADFELRILVMPKLWSRCPDNTQYVVSTDYTAGQSIGISSSFTIVAREGTRFEVNYNDLDGGIAEVLDHCLDDVSKAAARRVDPTPGEDNEDDEESNRRSPLISATHSTAHVKLRLTTGDRHAHPLLDLMPKEPWGRPECQTRDLRHFADYWAALQSLWLVSLCENDMKGLRFEGLGQMSSTAIEAFDLRLLLHISFVSQVTNLIWHVRPGYSRVTKHGPFIRGRMNAVSGALVLAGGGTTVECTYDEFGVNTPLLRVIVSALDEVCDAHQDHNGLPLSLDHGPVNAAAWLRRRFEAVPSLPRAAALRVGIGLQAKMAKVDSDWAEALDLACRVLDGRSLSPAPGSHSTALSWGDRHGTKAYVFDISTESCWENLVRNYFGKVRKPAGKESWIGIGENKAPDGWTEDKKVVFDAKYKEKRRTPAAGDQHQAFVYSHVFGSTYVLLIYPAATKGDTRLKKITRYYRCDSASAAGGRPSCQLAAICIPFPTRDHFSSRRKWNDFLNRRQKAIRKRLHRLP